jgi:hypothetical protein
MSTITRTMSEWAAGTRYEDLPAEVVTEAKRFLMDSVGCALGGAQQHDVHMARKVLTEIAGTGDATVLVTGKKMDPVIRAQLDKVKVIAQGIATPEDVERMQAAVNRVEGFDDVRELMAQLVVADR